MIDAMYRIQAVDSGAWAAPAPVLLPWVSCEHHAAVYGLADAMKRAEDLMALTGQLCRLVSSGLEWDFEQSVDFSSH